MAILRCGRKVKHKLFTDYYYGRFYDKNFRVGMVLTGSVGKPETGDFCVVKLA